MCCTPQRRAIFRHLNLKKRSRTFIFFLHVLTSKCASRHSAKFATSELQKVFPGPHLFEFKMCFRPQRRAIFRHQNFKKRSEPDMLFYIFTSKSAFRYSGVQFLISPVTTWLRTRRFALTGLLFDWPDTRIIEKTQHFATSLTFGADVSSFFWLSRYCIFFLLTWLLYSAFQLSILSEVRVLCASRHKFIHFFDIRTSKNCPLLTCFVIFTSKSAFPLQRRAIFDFSCTWLRARRFALTGFLRLTRRTNHWENTAFRDFSNIWRGCIFFLLTFALLRLLSADLTTLLCFSTVHIVGS